MGFCPPCQIEQWAFVQWDIVQWAFVLVGFCPSGLLSVPRWWVAWAVNFSFGHNRHGHEGGTIDTGCVCVEGGGGGGALVAAKWKPRRFQHHYLQCGAPMYPLRGVTLFSEGSGTGHHGGGHHSYIIGVLGHLVRGMGLGCYFGIE